MHEIVLIEDGCCHAGELDDYVEALVANFGERASVTKYAVGGRLGFSAVPLDLGNRLLAQGARSVPLIAVDGDLLMQGELPPWETSMAAISERLAEVEAEAEQASLTP